MAPINRGVVENDAAAPLSTEHYPANAMAELISEPLTPHAQTHGIRSMGIGEPGLPSGFNWRDGSYRIMAVVRAWKHSSREGGRAGGELYLRRHYYELRMDDGSIWTVYFLRQPPKSGNAKARWFLYTVDTPDNTRGE